MQDFSSRPSYRLLVALALLLVGTLGLAWAVTASRLPAGLSPLGKVITIGDVSLRVPKAYLVETAADGSTLLTAREPASASSRGLSSQVSNLVPGGRRLTLEVYKPQLLIPPSQYINEVLQFQAKTYDPFQLGRFPALSVAVSLGLREGADGGGNVVIGFRLYGVATLPSSRVLVLSLEGPGNATGADVEVLQRVAKTIDVAGEPTAGTNEDPFDVLRYRSVMSPVTLAESGDFAAESRAGGSLNASTAILYTDDKGQVATIEVVPVYLPPLPPDEEVPAKAEAGDPDEEPAVHTVARLLARSHDSIFANSTVKPQGHQRLLLTPDRRSGSGATVARAMTLSSDASPLSALIIIRAPFSMEPALTRLLNRAADRVSFDRRTDDLPGLVAAGTRLADRIASTPTTPRTITWSRPPSGPPVGTTQLPGDGTVTSRLGILAGGRLRPFAISSRSLAKSDDANVPPSILFSQWVYADGNATERWRVSKTPPRLARPILKPAPTDQARNEEASKSAGDAFADLLHFHTFVPADRLLDVLPTLTEPALLLTDTLPGVDTLQIGPPEYWLTLAIPLPSPAAGGQRPTLLLHPLGSPYALMLQMDNKGQPQSLTVRGELQGAITAGVSPTTRPGPASGPGSGR